MAIHISKYTEELKNHFKTKTDTKPWLHLVHDGQTGEYAVYVWDTRGVIEKGVR